MQRPASPATQQRDRSGHQRDRACRALTVGPEKQPIVVAPAERGHTAPERSDRQGRDTAQPGKIPSSIGQGLSRIAPSCIGPKARAMRSMCTKPPALFRYAFSLRPLPTSSRLSQQSCLIVADASSRHRISTGCVGFARPKVPQP
jgi:hypothetical protein